MNIQLLLCGHRLVANLWLLSLLLLASCDSGTSSVVSTPTHRNESAYSVGTKQEPESAPSPDLARAAMQAQATLQELTNALVEQDAKVAYIAIKKSFEEGLVEEWIWINNVSFDGTNFRGQVSNEPQLITSVQVGEKVDVNRDEICDWMVVQQDGQLRGGYTIRLELESMSAEEKEAFLQSSGLVL